MIDKTKLRQLEVTIERAKVLDLGSTPPTIITVQLPGGDGAKVGARWHGTPPLAVDDYVSLRKGAGDTVYVVTGLSGATAKSMVTGSGASGQVAYWDGVSNLAGDTDLTFDGTTLKATRLRAGTDSDYVEFVNGFPTFYGEATYYDDIRVPISAIILGGSKDPTFAVWRTNGAGSQGIFIPWFDKAIEEEVYFACQIPHGWKEEADMHPHVHWTPKTNGATGAVVSWGMEYAWVDVGEVAGNTSIIYGNVATPAVTAPVANTHYLTELTTISGAGHTGPSSMIVGRLFRNATGAGSSTDDYDDDAGLIEIDFHTQFNRLGTNTEYS